jgi:hypothetical protein
VVQFSGSTIECGRKHPLGKSDFFRRRPAMEDLVGYGAMGLREKEGSTARPERILPACR